MQSVRSKKTTPEMNCMQASLRDPAIVMRLDRMGSFHQTRLSFMRALLRNLYHQKWRFIRTCWRIDEKGVGIAVYQVDGPSNSYSLICFAHDLPPEKRSDRVIATEWDATFTLFDGIPTDNDIERLKHHVPKQEAGHCSQSELVLARANRSVRLFEHVVDCLSKGSQPNLEMIDSVGYLMRTTAVYGNGKFGISDRERIADRPEFASAFHAELLAVWLIRMFTIDIVEHLARARAKESFVSLEPEIRRRLGVGNSTGLGMAPFLVLHPSLIHSWMMARETALARVRSIKNDSIESQNKFSELLFRMMLGVESWTTTDERQNKRIDALRKDLLKTTAYVKSTGLESELAWHELVIWSESELTLEGQELIVTLLIELHPELVDDLADTMAIDEAQYFPIDGSYSIAQSMELIEKEYGWAIELDFSKKSETARFWYYSEEKLEPRIGERYEEPGADQEHPLSYARDISVMYRDLRNFSKKGADSSVAEFLSQHPQHRHSLRRIQTVHQLPYAEIQDNLISETMLPVDLLRCKLSFFGANKFDPKSDRWVRINMYQHAPFPDELLDVYQDDWIYPPLLP